MKTYSVPWEGPTLLACSKCQKKLTKTGDGLSYIKRILKKAKKGSLKGVSAHVVKVPCMKLCPKNAVAICRPEAGGDRLYVLRSLDGLAEILALPTQPTGRHTGTTQTSVPENASKTV